MRRILNKDVEFDERGLLTRKATREALLVFGYPVDVLSDEALSDKDGDDLINAEELTELLTALGEA